MEKNDKSERLLTFKSADEYINFLIVQGLALSVPQGILKRLDEFRNLIVTRIDDFWGYQGIYIPNRSLVDFTKKVKIPSGEYHCNHKQVK